VRKKCASFFGISALPSGELSMLNLYRRHTKKCTKGRRHHDRKNRDCKCIVYVEGKLNKASEYVKTSTGTRSWEEARRMVVDAETLGAWGASPQSAVLSIPQPEPKQAGPGAVAKTGGSVSKAIEQFLAEVRSAKGRNLAESTYGKYKTLLERLGGVLYTARPYRRPRYHAGSAASLSGFVAYRGKSDRKQCATFTDFLWILRREPMGRPEHSSRPTIPKEHQIHPEATFFPSGI
jgi:hypothetical protein